MSTQAGAPLQSGTHSGGTTPRGSQRRAASGRRFPPALTGGESLRGAIDTSAKVDWLTFTWLPDPDEHKPAALRAFLEEFTGLAVQGVDAPGMLGYDHGVRYFVQLDDGKEHHIARLDFGGSHHCHRARFDLSGSGCGRIVSWSGVKAFVESLIDVKLTRVDLAVDCLQGEYSVDHAAEWLRAGLWNAGGRMPKHSCPGDWLSETPVHGRTLEVGRRENGKMMRVYEKGRQLGDPSSSWTRWEVEIRNKDREIPTDILTRCDQYFVGAYKCLEQILDAASERIKTDQAEGTISAERLVESHRTAYGTHIHTLRAVLTADEVLDLLSRPGVPRRLEKASLAGLLNQIATSHRSTT